VAVVQQMLAVKIPFSALSPQRVAVQVVLETQSTEPLAVLVAVVRANLVVVAVELVVQRFLRLKVTQVVTVSPRF
jgi:hypothetical protein